MCTQEGFTAYMLACQRGQRDVAELIYHYRAAPSTNMTEEDGEEESVQVDTTTAEEEDACSIDLDEDTTFAAVGALLLFDLLYAAQRYFNCFMEFEHLFSLSERCLFVAIILFVYGKFSFARRCSGRPCWAGWMRRVVCYISHSATPRGGTGST